MRKKNALKYFLASFKWHLKWLSCKINCSIFIAFVNNVPFSGHILDIVCVCV